MEVPKQNINHSKRNQKYRKNGHQKANEPKIHFGTTILDRKKSKKRTDHQH